MSSTRTFAQRCEPLEALLPSRLRLPIRYGVQRLTGALEPEMVVLPELISPGDISVDVGANRGIYAYAMARIAAVVHCFEPLKECCDYIEAYKSPRIMVRNTALSETAGDFELFVPIENGRKLMTRASLDPIDGPHEKRVIPVARLDDFQLGPVAFIKVDVEGREFSVLRGAAATIRELKPKLLIEIDRTRHTMSSFQTIQRWLDDMGYEPYTANNGTLSKCLDPWRTEASVYNFVFLPRRAPYGAPRPAPCSQS